RRRRAPGAAEVDAPGVLALIGRFRTGVESRPELQPRGRLEEDFVARQQVGDRLRGIVRRFLRKQHDAAVDEAPLREVLRGCIRGQEKGQGKKKGNNGRRGEPPRARAAWRVRPTRPSRPTPATPTPPTSRPGPPPPP